MLQQETLDSADIKILQALQNDAKMTTKEIAALVNLSPSPVFERLKRLEREGYIQKYIAVLDAEKVGSGIIVLCNVSLKFHSKEFGEQFTNIISRTDEVIECYNTSGDYDYMMKLYVRDMNHYRKFVMDTLGTLDCIGSLHSIFVIGVVKNSHSIPIRLKSTRSEEF